MVAASEDSTTRGKVEEPKAEEAETTACSRDVEKTCSRDAMPGATPGVAWTREMPGVAWTPSSRSRSKRVRLSDHR